MERSSVVIQEVDESDFDRLGNLIASAYANLPGIFSESDRPEFYQDLRDVAGRAKVPGTCSLGAYNKKTGELLGGVAISHDMYSVDPVWRLDKEVAGIRMLAVSPSAAGAGVGRMLVHACIEDARKHGKTSIILHTVDLMAAAKHLYEFCGFQRKPEIDIRKGDVDVFGYELNLQDQSRI